MNKLLIILFISLACSGLSSAHSGRTDAKGGHWNHSTDSYHYHSQSNGSNSSNQDFLINLLDPDDHPKPCVNSRSPAKCMAMRKWQEEQFLKKILGQQSLEDLIRESFKSN